MNVSEVKNLLECKCLTGENLLDTSVLQAFGSDLMSDVLAFSSSDTLLLTGLTNSQVIRTAEMLDISAIVFVRGKTPDAETIELAKHNNKVLLTTDRILYTACGILFQHGLSGVDD